MTAVEDAIERAEEDRHTAEALGVSLSGEARDRVVLAAEVKRLRENEQARVRLKAMLDEGSTDGSLAEVWQEGYTSGHSRAMRRMSDEPDVEPGVNPYV